MGCSLGGGRNGKIMFSRSIRTENNNLQALLCSLNNNSYFLYKMIKDNIQEGKGTTSPIFCKDSGDKRFCSWKQLRCQPSPVLFIKATTQTLIRRQVTLCWSWSCFISQRGTGQRVTSQNQCPPQLMRWSERACSHTQRFKGRGNLGWTDNMRALGGRMPPQSLLKHERKCYGIQGLGVDSDLSSFRIHQPLPKNNYFLRKTELQL